MRAARRQREGPGLGLGLGLEIIRGEENRGPGREEGWCVSRAVCAAARWGACLVPLGRFLSVGSCGRELGGVQYLSVFFLFGSPRRDFCEIHRADRILLLLM